VNLEKQLLDMGHDFVHLSPNGSMASLVFPFLEEGQDRESTIAFVLLSADLKVYSRNLHHLFANKTQFDSFMAITFS